MTELTIKRKQHYPGCYRVVSAASPVMGQIKKNGREWQAEIRDRLTGDLRQFAGNWFTLKDAQNECARIMHRHYDAAASIYRKIK